MAQTAKTRPMMRRAALVLVVLVVLALCIAFIGCGPRSRVRVERQSPPSASPSVPPSTPIELVEAARLDQSVATLSGEGKLREAIPLAERSLELREKALGPRHPDVARSLHSLASLYEAQGDYARAEPLFVRALAIQEQALGPVHPDVARTHHDLAALYQAEGAWERAEPRALELALTTILRRKGRALDSAAPSAPVTIAQIQATLPPRAALVEIVRYRRFDARKAKGPWQEERYLAYVLPWRGPPRWVALGAAAQIDAGVDAALAAMRKDVAASAAKVALRNLDALVFAPIRDRLAGISHVILSPDAKLSFVPFEALIDPQGRHVLEQRLVSYVTSGRDLLRLAARQAPRSGVTIVADPDYGPGAPFRRLAGTLAEAQEIQRRFPGARALTGPQATKAALAAIAGPAVLHIATSGFYARSAAATAPLEPDEALDRAGLALAGANAQSDGIVSARELAGFDWSDTQLVVLSASESGAGVAPPGEGVYGLRRALVLAGAQSQIVSLWSIDDASTPELMRELYAELARGTGRAEALRQAKLRLLRQPRFAHPYYWAAFVLAGDWTPLDKGAMRLRASDASDR
jgi:CHAT domain-containing protein